ncbi:MAG: hypothetical protein KatS3mg042_0996 [Rhodothermaceae bacterium]|nr:MAG: hypothetical protein KatS3mg042_0996 [Rhodothermaceae bacterium]
MHTEHTHNKSQNELSLWIKPSKEVYRSREPILVEYLVENGLDQVVFLVDGPRYCAMVKDPDALICDPWDEEVILKFYAAEVPMGNLLDFNSYALPTLRRLESKETFKDTAVLCMPRRETIRNARGEVEERIVPMANRVGLMVAVGYGLKEYVRKAGGYGLLDDFLAWQQIVESNVVYVQAG